MAIREATEFTFGGGPGIFRGPSIFSPSPKVELPYKSSVVDGLQISSTAKPKSIYTLFLRCNTKEALGRCPYTVFFRS